MLNDIDYDELSSNMDKYVIFDVRNPEEVQITGHIPTTSCFPLKEIEEALKLDDESFLAKYGFAKPQADKTYVTHCRTGVRARQAGELLAAAGYNVRVYAGSFCDWKDKGGKIVPGMS